MICWSVHCKLSHCIFSSARGKSAASPGPTKQLRRETTAALQRGPSPPAAAVLQCCSAGQPSKPVGPQNWKLITFWTKMHTVLVIFYQNCTIMSKTCGTFIPFICYANANVETRHFRIQRYLKHKGSLKKWEFSLSGSPFYNSCYFTPIDSLVRPGGQVWEFICKPANMDI